jgi:serine/threonine protein kinase
MGGAPSGVLARGWPHDAGARGYRLLGAPITTKPFLRIAIDVATALSKVHGKGLIHKDIKPANILVNAATAAVHLTGFGVASRLLRERQPLAPPELIAGTLAIWRPSKPAA